MTHRQTARSQCYLAHSANSIGVPHRLKDHLSTVAALAKQHAARRPWEDEAALTGLLHDFGKYGDLFQARLRGEAQGIDHWSLGAWVALQEHHAVAAALAIEGHHVGLQAGNSDSLRRLVFADFPEHYVLEHHSLAGLGKESATGDAEIDKHNSSERQRRLLSQNWDAPIVLTTNIQLLESLFSNRPSACRKLHNLMDSVILLDEAQSLPQHLVVPTLAALSHLSTAYHTTVMFATATQPAFDALDDMVRKQAVSGW
ncbi:MAG: CRISPR-associated endonuclease Cas3'', partial [Gammaproteobacteria bacterium]